MMPVVFRILLDAGAAFGALPLDLNVRQLCFPHTQKKLSQKVISTDFWTASLVPFPITYAPASSSTPFSSTI